MIDNTPPGQTHNRTGRPRAVDLFSGAGGVSCGLREAGFRVAAAVEADALAVSTYRLNFPSVTMLHEDIRTTTAAALMAAAGVGKGELELLAGCPPCEGFSSLRTRNGKVSVHDSTNDLIDEFGRLAVDLAPRFVMLENVPALTEDVRFTRFVGALECEGYGVRFAIKDVSFYGVAQRRRRLVLLAAREGERALPADPAPGRQATVRRAIGKLKVAGQSGDALHDHGERRSDGVRRLIAAIPKDGGSRGDVEGMTLPCHERTDGFHDVYGRMAWDRPSPTITGGCVNPSKGRFLHPEEDRAITLREAAALQSFPPRHRFDMSHGKYAVAEMIGNALPPAFVRRHARPVADVLRSRGADDHLSSASQ